MQENTFLSSISHIDEHHNLLIIQFYPIVPAGLSPILLTHLKHPATEGKHKSL